MDVTIGIRVGTLQNNLIMDGEMLGRVTTNGSAKSLKLWGRVATVGSAS